MDACGVHSYRSTTWIVRPCATRRRHSQKRNPRSKADYGTCAASCCVDFNGGQLSALNTDFMIHGLTHDDLQRALTHCGNNAGTGSEPGHAGRRFQAMLAPTSDRRKAA